MNISVCMATYNGERFLAEQVSSILAQLDADDELVVVDDGSSDGTVAYFEGLQDSRVRVYRNERNMGYVFTFSKAIALSRHEYIFMADQDDVWVEGRVQAMKQALNTRGILLVTSASAFMDGSGQPVAELLPPLRADDSHRPFYNIANIFRGTAAYSGCVMAFRKALIPLILPISRFVEVHDSWMAMAANLLGANLHLEQVTLRRRVHGGNASVVKRPLRKKLWSRWLFVRSLVILVVRAGRLRFLHG